MGVLAWQEDTLGTLYACVCPGVEDLFRRCLDEPSEVDLTPILEELSEEHGEPSAPELDRVIEWFVVGHSMNTKKTSSRA